MHDIGSGALFDMSALGLDGEPIVSTSIDAGADLVLFSGDKLLGGPQAGVIVGRRKYIEQIERHPLMRALRVDKLTLAALASTLSSLAHPQQAARELPVWIMITTTPAVLKRRAEHIIDQLRTQATGFSVEVVSTTAYVGGGALPTKGLESAAIALRSHRVSEKELARRLRTTTPVVMGRLQDGCVLIDLRAVLPHQDESLLEALAGALQCQVSQIV
jgi:L-seryl-tRNA(Ser) seleniumtransferase